MTTTLILGVIVGAVLIWSGMVKRESPLRSSTRQHFIAMGLFILLLMAAVSVDEIYPWWSRFPKELLGAGGLILFLERTIRVVRARNFSGELVLDLGRISRQDLIVNLFAGLSLALLSVADIVTIVRWPVWAFRDVSLQVLGIAIAYAVLLQGVSRRSLKERGVFFGTGLLPWGEIRSFHWEKESASASMLVLHTKRRLPLFNIMTLSVRSEKAPALEELLRQHAIAPDGEAVGGPDPNPS